MIVVQTAMLLMIIPLLFLYRFIRIRRSNVIVLLEQLYKNQLDRYLSDSNLSCTYFRVPQTNAEKRALVLVMCKAFVKVQGSEQKEIKKLYKKFNLHNYSLGKFLSYNWTKQVEGIFEIGQLGIRGFNKYIEGFLDSKNRLVRSEARIATIKLLPYVPFAFMDSLQRSFTLWEQIIVYTLLIERKIELPQFSLWLNSPNDTVILFSLQMILKFNQRDGIDRIKLLRDHQDERVRVLVDKCLTNIQRNNSETLKTITQSKRIC